MKYETPELTAFKPAIDAIQSTPQSKPTFGSGDATPNNENSSAYQDWE
jgi:hypothetical protein